MGSAAHAEEQGHPQLLSQAGSWGAQEQRPHRGVTVWNTVVQTLASRVKMWIQILPDSKNCVAAPATSPLRDSVSFTGKIKNQQQEQGP